MALHILRDITADKSGKWYTIMVDDTTDMSNMEELVVSLIRVVDNDLKVYEEPVGLYSLESTSASAVVSTIKDVLLRMNLKIDNVPWPMLQWGQQHVWVKFWCRPNNLIGTSGTLHTVMVTH